MVHHAYNNVSSAHAATAGTCQQLIVDVVKISYIFLIFKFHKVVYSNIFQVKSKFLTWIGAK